MTFYFIRNSYFTQVEGWAFIGLRLGYTCLGVALNPKHWGNRRRPRWMPHLLLTLWAHTGQCDQRWIFSLAIGRSFIGWRTRGDATPDIMSYANAGLWLRRNPR